MKVSLEDIDPRFEMEIEGAEPWLEPIYSNFLVEDKSSKPLIQAKVEAYKYGEDVVRVQGTVNFRPLVACSRCAKTIPWPLHLTLDAHFRQPSVDEFSNKDRQLSKAELDTYFIENETIDIFALINDAILTALPSRYLVVEEETETCKICAADLSSEKVYGESDQDQSPFDKLKHIKWPH